MQVNCAGSNRNKDLEAQLHQESAGQIHDKLWFAQCSQLIW